MRDPQARLQDILDAVAAIQDHTARGSLADAVVFDAVRMRLIEIGEAVKAIDPALLATEPGVPWRNVAGTRHWLAHRYVDTLHAVVAETVRTDLEPLAAAARRLLERL